MLIKTVIALGTAASLFGLPALTTPAGAQMSTSPPAATGGEPDQGAQSGTTSGPASGSPSTFGTTGTTSGSPHQLGVIKDHNSGVQRETGQGEQSGTTQGTGSAGTGQPSMPGTEAGPPPTKSPTQ